MGKGKTKNKYQPHQNSNSNQYIALNKRELQEIISNAIADAEEKKQGPGTEITTWKNMWSIKREDVGNDVMNFRIFKSIIYTAFSWFRALLVVAIVICAAVAIYSCFEEKTQYIVSYGFAALSLLVATVICWPVLRVAMYEVEKLTDRNQVIGYAGILLAFISAEISVFQLCISVYPAISSFLTQMGQP